MSDCVGLLAGAAGLSHALRALIGFVGGIQGAISSGLGGSGLTAGRLSGSSSVTGSVSSTRNLVLKGGYAIGKRINGFLRGTAGEQNDSREGKKNVFHLKGLSGVYKDTRTLP